MAVELREAVLQEPLPPDGGLKGREVVGRAWWCGGLVVWW
jgi:hypothetical protein